MHSSCEVLRPAPLCSKGLSSEDTWRWKRIVVLSKEDARGPRSRLEETVTASPRRGLHSSDSLIRDSMPNDRRDGDIDSVEGALDEGHC